MVKKNFGDLCNRLHTIPACDGRTFRDILFKFRDILWNRPCVRAAKTRSVCDNFLFMEQVHNTS